MDVPITRPSMVSYADEIDFSQLLEKLLKNRHNGFMRITSGNDEGYILFKDGKQVAAEYDRFSKSKAIENIMSAAERSDTVIEIFDLKSSHMNYLIDVNKPYLLEPDFDINKILNELKGLDNAEPLIPEKISKNNSLIDSQSESKSEPAISELVSNKSEKEPDQKQKEKETPESENKTESTISKQVSEVTDTPKSKESEADTINLPESETVPESKPSEPDAHESKESEADTINLPDSETVPEFEQSEPVSEPEDVETDKTSPASGETSSIQNEEKTTVSTATTTENIPEIEKTSIKPDSDIDESSKSKDTLKEELKTIESKPQSEIEIDEEVKEEPIDRSKLMEKYGIKEMNEEDVEGILDDYKGGSLNEEDVEKIELSLMNKIKKSVFGIPKIKGVEVMVFLENATELSGDINIIIEYEAKGFFSRLMGESKDIENLRRQVINIVQIEIKKSFRKYPEIVNNFNINVEIS